MDAGGDISVHRLDQYGKDAVFRLEEGPVLGNAPVPEGERVPADNHQHAVRRLLWKTDYREVCQDWQMLNRHNA